MSNTLSRDPSVDDSISGRARTGSDGLFTVISGVFKPFFYSNNIYGFYCSGKSKT